MRAIIILCVILALLLGGVIFAKQKGYVGQEKLTKVASEEVKERTIVQTVSASGKIYPEVELKLTSDVSGEIIGLYVAEGDSVKKGALLAKVDPDLYNSAVERADAAVNSAKANTANSSARIIQLQAQLEQAKRTRDRTKSLFEQEVIAEAEYLDTETVVKTMQAEINAANELVEAANFNVKSAEAGLTEAKRNLQRTKLYAPMSGVVSTLNVEEGERVVGTSQFEGTEILRISNLSNMELQVDVSENDIVKVQEGQNAKLEIDAYPTRKFDGIVTEISNAQSGGAAAMMSNDQVTNFKVKIRLVKESYADLLESGNRFAFRPGMSASADIETKRLEDVVAVPIQAVATREVPDSLKTDDMEDDLLEIVFLVEGGAVKQHTVKTGIQDDNYIRILDGISANSEVVSAPYREISKKLEDGQNVEVVDKEDLFKKDDKDGG